MTPPRSRRPTPLRIGRLAFRPRLEACEPRTLLAAWTPIGPAPQSNGMTLGGFPSPNWSVTGRVTAVAFGQYLGESALFLGTAGGGVWRGTNYGSTPTWTPLTDTVGLPVGATSGLGAGANAVGAIAVDPNHPSTIYVGTGEANYTGDSHPGTGILKSTDAGTTWSVNTGGASNPFFGQSVSKIVIDPTDPSGNTVYAAVVPAGNVTPKDAPPTPVDGIYKSTDGGATWALMTNSGTHPIGPSIAVTDLDYTVNAGGAGITLFAGLRSGLDPSSLKANPDTLSGIWESTDGGVSWTQLLTGTPSSGTVRRISLAANHTPGSGTVYAAVVQLDDSLQNVYKTTTNGAGWAPAAATPPPNATGTQGHYDLALGLSPGGDLYLGGQSNQSASPPQNGFLKLARGAATWAAIDRDPNGHWPHTDAHAVAFGPDGAAYVGTDGGPFRTNGLVWSDLNTTGLQTNQVYGVALSPTTANTILEGSQDNGTALTTDATSWETVGGADGAAVRFAPSNSQVAYKTTQQGALSYSNDAGAHWTDLTGPNGQAYPFVTHLAVDPGDPTHVLLSGYGTIFESRTSGSSPTSIGPDIPLMPNEKTAVPVTALAVTPVTGVVGCAGMTNETAYAGLTDGRFLEGTFNGSWTWAFRTGPWGNSGPVTAIAINPLYPNIVYATVGAPSGGTVDRVWMSKNSGNNWADISAGLPNDPADAVALDISYGYDHLYVGTDDGVYQGIEPTSGPSWGWTRSGTGLPNVPVDDLQLQPYGANQTLAAATYGRGVWTTSVPTGPNYTGNGGGGTMIAGCNCSIPSQLQMTSSNPSSNNHMFQDATLIYQQTPMEYCGLPMGTYSYLSTQSFTDQFNSTFRYYFYCQRQQFFLTRVYVNSIFGSPYEDTIRYTWTAGTTGNTTSPFDLANGRIYAGGDTNCVVTITGSGSSPMSMAHGVPATSHGSSAGPVVGHVPLPTALPEGPPHPTKRFPHAPKSGWVFRIPSPSSASGWHRDRPPTSRGLPPGEHPVPGRRTVHLHRNVAYPLRGSRAAHGVRGTVDFTPPRG